MGAFSFIEEWILERDMVRDQPTEGDPMASEKRSTLEDAFYEFGRMVGEKVVEALEDVTQWAEEQAQAIKDEAEANPYEAVEYGRTYKHEMNDIIAAAEAASRVSSSAAIGARPSALEDFAVNSVELAAIQDLSTHQYGAAMLAIGYALAGGELLSADQEEADNETARREYEESKQGSAA
jgi:hypothetical protein